MHCTGNVSKARDPYRAIAFGMCCAMSPGNSKEPDEEPIFQCGGGLSIADLENPSAPGKCVTFIFLITLLLGLLGGCAREKDRLDEEVRRLCAIDGGIKVYETVVIDSDRFDQFGVLEIPIKNVAKPGDDFYYEWELKYYKTGNPEMWRSHFKIFRQQDGGLLGESIRYARRGGDIPGPWHDSSFGCPDTADVSVLKKQIFHPNGKEK